MHPGDFAGEIDIIGAIGGTGLDEGRAIELIGANSGEDAFGGFHHVLKGFRVGSVRDDQVNRLRNAHFVTYILQLLKRAPGHGPSDLISHAIGLIHVFGHKATGETSGAINDDIELCGWVHGAASSFLFLMVYRIETRLTGLVDKSGICIYMCMHKKKLT